MHKAFRALSLINHPDHNADSDHATEQFQVLVKVHDLLMCPDSRKIYDDTGKVGAPSIFVVSDDDFQECKRSYQGREYCFDEHSMSLTTKILYSKRTKVLELNVKTYELHI